jgi:hypothetical protein
MAFTTVGLLINLITAVITIPISGLLLMLSAKIFKLSDTSYKTAVKVAAILGVSSFVLSLVGMVSLALTAIMGFVSFVGVSVLLALWLIKKEYTLPDWKQTALVWVVWFVLNLVAVFLLALILTPLFILLGIGAAALG